MLKHWLREAGASPDGSHERSALRAGWEQGAGSDNNPKTPREGGTIPRTLETSHWAGKRQIHSKKIFFFVVFFFKLNSRLVEIPDSIWKMLKFKKKSRRSDWRDHCLKR